VFKTLRKPLGGLCEQSALYDHLLDATDAYFNQCKFSSDKESIDNHQHEGREDPDKIRELRHRF
jgi:hypothetical protein